MRTLGSLLLCLTSGCAVVGRQDPPPGGPPQEQPKFLACIGGGLAHWDTTVGETLASNDGSIDRNGYDLDLSLEAYPWKHGDLSYGVGFDIGYSGFDMDGRNRPTGWLSWESPGSASLLRLLPTLNGRLALDPRVALVAKGGVGYYQMAVDVVQEDVFSWLSFESDTRTVWRRDTVGGFVGLGLDFGDPEWPVTMRVEYRMHVASFGTNDEFVPSGGSIRGPIHTFSLGVCYQF